MVDLVFGNVVAVEEAHEVFHVVLDEPCDAVAQLPEEFFFGNVLPEVFQFEFLNDQCGSGIVFFFHCFVVLPGSQSEGFWWKWQMFVRVFLAGGGRKRGAPV